MELLQSYPKPSNYTTSALVMIIRSQHFGFSDMFTPFSLFSQGHGILASLLLLFLIVMTSWVHSQDVSTLDSQKKVAWFSILSRDHGILDYSQGRIISDTHTRSHNIGFSHKGHCDHGIFDSLIRSWYHSFTRSRQSSPDPPHTTEVVTSVTRSQHLGIEMTLYWTIHSLRHTASWHLSLPGLRDGDPFCSNVADICRQARAMHTQVPAVHTIHIAVGQGAQRRLTPTYEAGTAAATRGIYVAGH